MQDDQLVLTRFLERAAAFHPHSPIVTRTSGGTERTTYGELAARAARLAGALRDLGIGRGDRVATFAWNSARHLELYFAVPLAGAVLHTLNVRLHHDQVAWIVRHAEDRAFFVDGALARAWGPVAEALGPDAARVVELRDRDEAGAIPGSIGYEDLLASAEPPPAWPDLDEDDAALLCYTSGTTGPPKGVLSSHRSLVLHAQMVNQAAVLGLTERDTVLPVVPMFHAAAWGLPYAATLAGARQVFASRWSGDPAAIAGLLESERVTVAAGVPTVWIGLLRYLEDDPHDLSALRVIKTGGAAVPPALIERYETELGVPILQGWGMTETGPLASIASLPAELQSLPDPERYRLRAGQGRAVPGIRTRVVDPATGAEVPHDGTSAGELEARGAWVASGYYRDEERSRDALDDGWLRTGDVATVDEHGLIHLVDRTKDLVKSGGEWISSLQLENALMGHPAVVEAAVVAVPDERWGERPLACVVIAPGAGVSPEDLRAFIEPRFPRWWLPERFAFLDALPKTSVGKFDKRALRARFAAGP